MHLPGSKFAAILEGYVMFLVALTDGLTINYRNFGTLTQYEGWNDGLPEDDHSRCFWIRVAVHFGQLGKLLSGDAVVEVRVIESSSSHIFGFHGSRWEVPLEFELQLKLDIVIVLLLVLDMILFLDLFVNNTVDVAVEFHPILLRNEPFLI